MIFDWSDYLHLAEDLAGRAVVPPSQEAKLRSAISRAYYAAFCKARNFLRDKKGDTRIPSGGEAHRYVRNRFKTSGDKSYKSIGANLNRLRLDRGKADYDDTISNPNSLASASLKRSRQALKILSSL